MLIVRVAAAAAKAAEVVGRATLYALGAELLTSVEVVRYGEVDHGAHPGLINIHHALEGGLLDGDVLGLWDDIIHAELQG